MENDINIEQLKAFIQFFEGRLTPAEFLGRFDGEDVPSSWQEITFDELKQREAFRHEIAHFSIWTKYKTETKFYKNSQTSQCATVATNLQTVCADYSADRIMSIVKEALFEPYNWKIRTKMYNDLFMYDALIGELRESDLDNSYEDLRLALKNKYHLHD